MTEYDDQIAAVLERLRPTSVPAADWERVITDARLGGPSQRTNRSSARPRLRSRLAWSRRSTIVGLLACLVLAIPLVAVGTTGWWFQRPQPQFLNMEPKPIDGMLGIIATGHWQGTKWTALGYVSKQVGFKRVNGKPKPIGGTMVCTTTITGSLSNNPNGQGCGGLYGMKGVVGRAGGWTTFINQRLIPSRSSSPSLVAGAAAAEVARLVAVLNPYPYPNGNVRKINVPLISLKQVGDGIHFYVFTYPRAVGVSALVLYDATGHVLKRLNWG